MAPKEHDLLPPLTEIQAVKYFNTLKVFSTWEKGREFLGLDGVKMLTDFLEKLSGYLWVKLHKQDWKLTAVLTKSIIKNDKIYISNIAKIQTFDSTKIHNYKRYYVIFLAWKFKWKFGDSASKLFVYPL